MNDNDDSSDDNDNDESMDAIDVGLGALNKQLWKSVGKKWQQNMQWRVSVALLFCYFLCFCATHYVVLCCYFYTQDGFSLQLKRLWTMLRIIKV